MCDCQEKMDAALQVQGARLLVGIQLTSGLDLVERLCVSTTWIGDQAKRHRKAPPTVFASCCPFCGESKRSASEPKPRTPEVEEVLDRWNGQLPLEVVALILGLDAKLKSAQEATA